MSRIFGLIAALAAMVIVHGCATLPPAKVVSAQDAVVSGPAAAPAPLAPGEGRFILQDWGGPAIPVWTFAPTQADLATAPIVIVLHGAMRDGDRYRAEWAALAQLNRFIVLAPEFARADFPTSASYNHGGVFGRDGQTPTPEARWAFSAIEPLFSTALKLIDGRQEGYTLYGHSAGSQFAHRFLFLKPQARAKRIIAANAGWYTMPTFAANYPAGLGGTAATPEQLRAALQKDVIVLLGEFDTDLADPDLPSVPEAIAQGPHRLARGKFFFETAKGEAAAMGVPFGWRLRTVPFARHANGEMALIAAEYVE